MKIQKVAGELSFGANDEIRISRISATSNLDISGNSNLIFDVSGTGIKVLNPTCSLDVSGTVNTRVLNIEGAIPKIYVKSVHWIGIGASGSFKEMLMNSTGNNDKWSWSVGYDTQITWYGFSFAQDDDPAPTAYELQALVDTGSGFVAQNIENDDPSDTDFDFTGPNKGEAVYKDFNFKFTTNQGDKIRLKLKDTDTGTSGEESDVCLFGYYELT